MKNGGDLKFNGFVIRMMVKRSAIEIVFKSAQPIQPSAVGDSRLSKSWLDRVRLTSKRIQIQF